MVSPLQTPGGITRSQPWDNDGEINYDGLNPLPVTLGDNPVAMTGTVKSKLWVSQLLRPNYGATSGALDAGDAAGDKIVIDRSVDGEPLPKKGRILRVTMMDQADQTSALTLHLFNDDFTAAASDAAFSISAADGLKWVTSVNLTVVTDLGSVRVAEANDCDVDYYAVGQRLVAQASTAGTPTFGAGTMPVYQLFVLPLE